MALYMWRNLQSIASDSRIVGSKYVHNHKIDINTGTAEYRNTYKKHF